MDKWNEMEYEFVLVPITCTSEFNMKTFKEEGYILSEVSKREIVRFAKSLRKCKEPSLIVFASCFSYESSIKDYLYANGIMATLSLSLDKGEVSDGKVFILDIDQQNTIEDFAKVIASAKLLMM